FRLLEIEHVRAASSTVRALDREYIRAVFVASRPRRNGLGRPVCLFFASIPTWSNMAHSFLPSIHSSHPANSPAKSSSIIVLASTDETQPARTRHTTPDGEISTPL